MPRKILRHNNVVKLEYFDPTSEINKKTVVRAGPDKSLMSTRLAQQRGVSIVQESMETEELSSCFVSLFGRALPRSESPLGISKLLTSVLDTRWATTA
ncbi:hypothetical protein ElyMa_002257500 [Elysia marginata]|uniref:Uncharacterized protein n=1 Tax=Elysia marginata TaxID=1093978 RepID=A0AAV4FXY7_9GAST|nr:hypothetical protein ElyMa_002257500 [Elysia marginata]